MLSESAAIVIKGPKGDEISIEVIDTNHKIIPKISDKGDLSATIQIGFSSNVAEIKGREDITSKETLDYLEKQQNSIVRKEITDVIEYAQKEDLDMFSISFNFNYLYPMVWSNLEKNWSERFSKIKFNIEVDSMINRSYLITKPTGSKESDSK